MPGMEMILKPEREYSAQLGCGRASYYPTSSSCLIVARATSASISVSLRVVIVLVGDGCGCGILSSLLFEKLGGDKVSGWL
jgi:hypothetical protein